MIKTCNILHKNDLFNKYYFILHQICGKIDISIGEKEMYIFSQVLGVAGIISILASIAFDTRKKLPLFEIMAIILFGLQYLILKAIPAVVMLIILFIRCIVFFYIEKKYKKVPFFVLVLFLISIIAAANIMKYGIMEGFPVICTFIYTIGIWQKNTNIRRIIMLFISCILVGYNVYVSAYSLLFLNIFEIITSLIAIYNINLNDKKTKKRRNL